MSTLRRKGKTIELEVSERLMDGWYGPATDPNTGEVLLHHGKGYLVRKPKYYVRIKDSPGHWSAGRSRAEAIGELIRTHGEAFGIKVSDLGVLAR